MPAFVFEGMTGLSITLAVLYALVAVHTTRRLLWLHVDSPDALNTRKLFVMTLLTTAVLRTMSFSSMAILDLANTDFNINPAGKHSHNSGSSSNREFFDKAFLVLFDFPDFCCISAYVLLIVVWAESYLKSRRHWLSSYRFRKMWMLAYLVFNVLLYSIQVALYSLLFFPSINENIELNLIYLTMASFNMGIPVAWSLIYFYLAIQFSGFPFASEDAKLRLWTLSRLGVLWTCARLGWGVTALTTVVQGWLIAAQQSSLFYTCVLISIFLLVEIIPICVSIQPEVLNHFAESDVGHNGNAAEDGYGTATAASRYGHYHALPVNNEASQYNVLLRAGYQPPNQSSSGNTRSNMPAAAAGGGGAAGDWSRRSSTYTVDLPPSEAEDSDLDPLPHRRHQKQHQHSHSYHSSAAAATTVPRHRNSTAASPKPTIFFSSKNGPLNANEFGFGSGATGAAGPAATGTATGTNTGEDYWVRSPPDRSSNSKYNNNNNNHNISSGRDRGGDSNGHTTTSTTSNSSNGNTNSNKSSSFYSAANGAIGEDLSTGAAYEGGNDKGDTSNKKPPRTWAEWWISES
mmetsp:Transcript_3050/g.4753  ORF Transcript_3050/g.4753 Transcript_3050/m.4753 type:complete len:573 (-) Transcript_3050:55-1773(-)